MTPQPLCRRCDKPAFVVFNGVLLCAAHLALQGNSAFAKGLASSGDDVTAGGNMPPHPVSPAVTDPFRGNDRNATAFRNIALNSIEPKESQVSSGG